MFNPLSRYILIAFKYSSQDDSGMHRKNHNIILQVTYKNAQQEYIYIERSLESETFL